MEVISAAGQYVYVILPFRAHCKILLPSPWYYGVVVMGEAHDQLWPMRMKILCVTLGLELLMITAESSRVLFFLNQKPATFKVVNVR